MKAEDFLAQALKADGETMVKPEALLKEETCVAAGKFMAKRYYEETNSKVANELLKLLNSISGDDEADDIKIIYEELWAMANPFNPPQAYIIEEARRKTLETLQGKASDEELLQLSVDLPDSLSARSTVTNVRKCQELVGNWKRAISNGETGDDEAKRLQDFADDVHKAMLNGSVDRMSATMITYLTFDIFRFSETSMGGPIISTSAGDIANYSQQLLYRVHVDGEPVSPLEFVSFAEAEKLKDSLATADPDNVYTVEKDLDPISALWDSAPVGGLDRSNTDYQFYFRRAFIKALLPLTTQHIKTDIVTLDGFFTEVQFENLYGRVADYLDLTDVESVMKAAANKQQPPWRVQKRVSLDDYLTLYKKPIEVILTEDGTAIESMDPIDSWLEPDFDIGTEVTIWQENGNYVVVWPEDHPETRTDSLLLPKTCLGYYQPIEIPNVSEQPELSEEEMQVIRDRKTAQKEDQLRRKALRLDVEIKADKSLTTMINPTTGELRQFTKQELFDGAAGFDFDKTRLIKMGGQIYPVALASLVNICADKGYSCQILESGTGGPLKVEIPESLLRLVTQMGAPLRAQVQENNKVVVTY
jgi:hypothetical protein